MNPEASKYLAAIGRQGGKAKGGAKADTARANGKLGGRPKKKKRVVMPAVRHSWFPIEEAPKGATSDNPCREHWILGTDGRECKVIRWCMEYPCSDGVWMYAYEPSEYIDGIQQFYPSHWMPLPSLPNAPGDRLPDKNV